MGSSFLRHDCCGGLEGVHLRREKEVSEKNPTSLDSHSIPSAVKCHVKQCPNNLLLETQLFAGVSEPFRLIHSSFPLIDISLICENQITITPDFLPH